jgi:thymidylate kinase
MKKIKIAITGSHGSGKTTLGLRLTYEFKKKGINAHLMEEVARESPYLQRGIQGLETQLHIFSSQIERELKNQLMYDILITDRSILDHVVYMEIFCPKNKFSNSIRDLAYEFINTYDYIFKTTYHYDLNVKDFLRPKRKNLQKEFEEIFEKLKPSNLKNFFYLPKNKKLEFIFDKINF